MFNKLFLTGKLSGLRTSEHRRAALLLDLTAEVAEDYKDAMQRAAIDYLMLDAGERARLGVHAMDDSAAQAGKSIGS